MDNVKSVFSNASGFVGRMTASQVMMLFGLIAGAIVGTIVLVGWINSVNYARLYSNLEPAEAGEVVAYLNDNKIPYKLADNGSSIEVPSDDVYSTRISLASQGLPREGTIGYSLFDKNNLGMTDFLQNLNFRRALEGELTRTIMQLSEVQAARVHIVMPKDRLFKEDKKEATASVVLKLRRRDGLSASQLDGITHLVAASVEGLKPNNIAIVDYEGNLLSGGRETDAVAGLSDTQLDARRKVETYLQEKAQSLLDGVLGLDKAIVRVTADLNFQQAEKTSETFDPNAPVIRSEERTKTSNAVTDKTPETSESNEQGSTETNVTNYEISKTVEHIVSAVGSIERLSIAVMVDGMYSLPEGAEENTAPTYQPRSQEDLDRLSSIVKNAVGFDPQRNDQLEMVNIPFDRQTLENDQQMLDSMYQREYYMEIGKVVGLILLALLAFLYLKRKSKNLFAALGRIMPPPAPVAAMQIQQQAAAEAALEHRRPRMTDNLQTAAKQHPDEIAKVIRTMMAE
ncbi:MAG: flagellar basal-body MS-ring/collar protein FliF [candidate division Zixibacteria bacterium]|nr:flagellar basal-body MS-ring/collar protein FliF [candidate division Zixibacteria bacterium]